MIRSSSLAEPSVLQPNRRPLWSAKIASGFAQSSAGVRHLRDALGRRGPSAAAIMPPMTALHPLPKTATKSQARIRPAYRLSGPPRDRLGSSGPTGAVAGSDWPRPRIIAAARATLRHWGPRRISAGAQRKQSAVKERPMRSPASGTLAGSSGFVGVLGALATGCSGNGGTWSASRARRAGQGHR